MLIPRYYFLMIMQSYMTILSLVHIRKENSTKMNIFGSLMSRFGVYIILNPVYARP